MSRMDLPATQRQDNCSGCRTNQGRQEAGRRTPGKASMKCKRILILGSSALMALAAFAPAAHADVTVNAGSLDFDPAGAPTIGNFDAVTLNGNPQLTSLQVAPFTIIDATGSAAGWNVTLTVPDLVNGGSTIAASQVSMTAPTVVPAAGASMTGVAGHASAGAFATGEKIVTAAATDGAGTYLVSPAILKLTVPVDALTGTYTSSAVIAVNSGP